MICGSSINNPLKTWHRSSSRAEIFTWHVREIRKIGGGGIGSEGKLF